MQRVQGGEKEKTARAQRTVPVELSKTKARGDADAGRHGDWHIAINCLILLRYASSRCI